LSFKNLHNFRAKIVQTHEHLPQQLRLILFDSVGSQASFLSQLRRLAKDLLGLCLETTSEQRYEIRHDSNTHFDLLLDTLYVFQDRPHRLLLPTTFEPPVIEFEDFLELFCDPE
jgi:hypothetical protein